MTTYNQQEIQHYSCAMRVINLFEGNSKILLKKTQIANQTLIGIKRIDATLTFLVKIKVIQKILTGKNTCYKLNKWWVLSQ